MMMVVCIMLFFATLIVESYKGNFISILLLKKVNPPFNNYYSLYHKTDYEVGYLPGTNIDEIFLVYSLVYYFKMYKVKYSFKINFFSARMEMNIREKSLRRGGKLFKLLKNCMNMLESKINLLLSMM